MLCWCTVIWLFLKLEIGFPSVRHSFRGEKNYCVPSLWKKINYAENKVGKTWYKNLTRCTHYNLQPHLMVDGCRQEFQLQWCFVLFQLSCPLIAGSSWWLKLFWGNREIQEEQFRRASPSSHTPLSHTLRIPGFSVALLCPLPGNPGLHWYARQRELGMPAAFGV